MKRNKQGFKKNHEATRISDALLGRVWVLNGKKYKTQRDIRFDNYIGKGDSK